MFDPVLIYQLIKKGNDIYFQKTLDDAKNAAKRARQNGLLYEFLKEMYGNNILEREGRLYPLVVYPINKKQSIRPESIKGTLDHEQIPNLTKEIKKQGESYLKILKKLNAPITNRRTYRLINIKHGKKLELDCGLGWYEDAISTCDLLEWELLTKFGSMSPPKKDFMKFKNKLNCRQSLVDPDEMLNMGKNTSRAIAISTLVIFKYKDRWATFIRERSPRSVAVHSDLLHVIPSFMFQPMIGQIDDEYNITYNIYREYLEELFSKEEVEKAGGEVDPLYFIKDNNLQYLLKLIKEKKAHLILTGIAINLFNLRPEICALLLIETPEWWKNHSKGTKKLSKIKINHEFKTSVDLAQEKKDIVVFVDLGKNMKIPDYANIPTLINLKDPANWVPPGIAALFLGVETARKKLGFS